MYNPSPFSKKAKSPVPFSRKAKSPVSFSFGEGARRADEVKRCPQGG